MTTPVSIEEKIAQASELESYKILTSDEKEVFKAILLGLDATPVEAGKIPKAHFMSGQSGSGKTTVRAAVLDGIADPHKFVIIDPDEIRVLLSLEVKDDEGNLIRTDTYQDLLKANDKTAAAKSHPQAKKIADALYEWAIANRYNVLDDRALGSPEIDSERFRKLKEESSHETHLQINAISAKKFITEASILYRYEEKKAEIGVGRFVPPAHHERAYDNTLPTLNKIEDGKLCDFIKVFKRLPDRDTELICDRRLENQKWLNNVGEKSASETLQEERERDYSNEEIVEFRNMIQQIRIWHAARNATNEEKRYVEKLEKLGNERFEYEALRRNWNIIEAQTGVSADQFVANLAAHDNNVIQALSGDSAIPKDLDKETSKNILDFHPDPDQPIVINDLTQTGGRIPPDAVGWCKGGLEGEEKRFVLIDYETGSPRYTIITRQQASLNGGRMMMYEKDMYRQEKARIREDTEFIPARGDRAELLIEPHNPAIRKNKLQSALNRATGKLRSAKESITGNVSEWSAKIIKPKRR